MELVSVIIPAKNRPGMLKHAVESVVAQTYRPVEIIIVLTGATKATHLAALELSTSYAIRLLETEPLNLAATRNAGLAIAEGAWVSFLDDDDIWLPEKLQAQMSLAKSVGADVVTTNWTRFGEGMTEEVWMPQGGRHFLMGSLTGKP